MNLALTLEKMTMNNNESHHHHQPATMTKDARTVRLTIRETYGTQRLYPANDQAEILCRLLKRKVLPVESLRDVKALGFDIVIQQPTINLEGV